jgi:hypothetical protein
MLGDPTYKGGTLVALGDVLTAAEGLVFLCSEPHCRAFVSTAGALHTLRRHVEGGTVQRVAATADSCLWSLVSHGGPLYLEVGHHAACW